MSKFDEALPNSVVGVDAWWRCCTSTRQRSTHARRSPGAHCPRFDCFPAYFAVVFRVCFGVGAGRLPGGGHARPAARFPARAALLVARILFQTPLVSSSKTRCSKKHENKSASVSRAGNEESRASEPALLLAAQFYWYAALASLSAFRGTRKRFRRALRRNVATRTVTTRTLRWGRLERTDDEEKKNQVASGEEARSDSLTAARDLLSRVCAADIVAQTGMQKQAHVLYAWARRGGFCHSSLFFSLTSPRHVSPFFYTAFFFSLSFFRCLE